MHRVGLIAFVDAPAPAPAPVAEPPAPAPGPAPAPAPTAAPAAPAPAPTAAPSPSPAPAPTAAPAPAADAKPTPKAPEQYADFTMPEGMQADAQSLEQFKGVFKELDLPQDAAQRLVTAQAEVVRAQVTGWKQQAAADKEIGGDKFDENLAVAKKALEKFGTPEFNAWLDKTGMGFHPELIRVLFRAGKAISEDGFVAGRQGQSGGQSIAQRMYPNMNP